MMPASRGVIYIAVGSPLYGALVHFSIRSLRDHNCGVPVTVLTDMPVAMFDLPDVTTQLVASRSDARRPGMGIKTMLGLFSEWEECLYLDADVACVKDPSAVWDMPGELVLAPDIVPSLPPEEDFEMAKYAKHLGVTAQELLYTVDYLSGDFPYYNSGVILWRGDLPLWDAWRRQWMRFKDVDQLALCRALKDCGQEVSSLPQEFNSQGTPRESLDGTVFWHTWNDRFAWHREVYGGELTEFCEKWAPDDPGWKIPGFIGEKR